MTTTPNHGSGKPTTRHEGSGSVLPLAIRQRLWDQVWSRLLAPPVDPADKTPAPRERNPQDGGPR